MSVQAQITGDLKVRELTGGLYAESGIVTSKPFGGADGFATLGGDGKVPSSQLPSYVDDVVEVANYAALPIPGETGKIYVTLDTNYIYRWSGSTYIQIIDTTAVWGAITGTLSDQIDLQDALNAKVPYTGATNDVDLGTFGLKGDYIGFNTTPSSIPTTLGTMSWDNFYRTAQIVTGDGDTTLQVGQEQVTLVHNNTGSTLTDGQVVYVTGSTGELPSVALASNTTEATSSVTFGVVTETILNGADGFITTSGMVHGLNTLAFNEGDALWLGSTAGTFTNVKPVAPNNSVLVGYVVKKAGGNGSIFVKIQNGYELEELHDVLITSVADKQGIFWDSATNLWKNNSIAGILGYTPQAELTLTTTGSSGAATLIGSTLNIPNYSSGLGGYVPYVGATGPVNLGPYNLTVNSVIVGRGTSTNTTNIAIGDSNTMGYSTPATGGDNTAVGSSSLYVLSTGYGNTAVGRLALAFVTSGIYNTAVGNGAGSGFTSGSKNTMIGYLSGYNVLSGSANTLIGGWQGENPMSNNVALSDGDGNVRYRFDGTNNNFYQKVIFGSTLGNGTYTYTLPSATGTLALTSDIPSISGYVPYTGATQSVNLGTNVLTSYGLNVNQTGSNLSSVYFNNGGNAKWIVSNNGATGNFQIVDFVNSTTRLSIQPNNLMNLSGGASVTEGLYVTDTLYLKLATTYAHAAGYYGIQVASNLFIINTSNTTQAVFGLGSLTTSRQYTLPDASGTLALTSNLSSYLTLAGGTLTGQLYVNTGGSDNQLALVGTAPSLRLTNAISGATINGFIAMSGAANNYIQGSVSGDMCIGNQNNGKILFGFGAGTATMKMAITSTGNVGIGTSSPTTYGLAGKHLELFGGSDYSFIHNNTTTVKSFYAINESALLAALFTFSNHPLTFGTNNTERMRIANNYPSLLINGTNNLWGAINRGVVHINGDSAIYGITIGGSNAGYVFHSGTDMFINQVKAGGAMSITNEANNYLAFGTNSTERMRITSGGSLCINSSAPPSVGGRLCVYEPNATWALNLYHGYTSQYFIEFLSSGQSERGAIYSFGGALTYATSSDYRLKEDYKEFNALEKVMSIPVYDFKWKEAGIRDYGFKAHELQSALPSLVSGEKDELKEDGSIKPQMADYGRLTPILLKAIQEQQAQIEAQYAKIEELKALIAAK